MAFSPTMSRVSEAGSSVVGSVVGGVAPILSETGSRVVYVNNPGKNLGFCDNKVITAKYTKLNFLPRFMYARLSQVANFYFLLVGAGQIIPAISSTQGLPYQWMVLLIVLSVDAVFAAIEDNARHHADKKMNARTTRVFDANEPSCFREIIWRDVSVGSILKVCNYEAVPADLLLLAVSEPDAEAPVGICFVETKSLDGETNLKVRQALSCTFSQLSDPRSLGHLPGRVIFEQPNHDVNNFSGRFEPHQGHTIPIDLKNIALRGSVIRNTPYAYGLVLNTGKDTKIMQSSSETPMKTSKILMIVNRGIGILMAALLVLCVLGSVLCSVWVAQNYSRARYLMLDDLSGTAPFRNDIIGWVIYLGYYWILIASFVPITLYVTIAIVKSYQTFFLNRDIHMYDEPSDTPALVRNADLNDDLGQVTHIFSDKTGTLTANVMDFRKMSIHGVSYGRGTTEIGREAHRRLGKDISTSDILADNMPYDKVVENVYFVDPQDEFRRDSNHQTNPVQALWIEAFLVHLAVCHSVVLEQGEDKLGLRFSASSPDELALVSGAKFLGYEFVARKNGSVSIKMPGSSKEVVYELLEMIEFTSTRKRMSVVVRTPDKRILLLTKGADSVIFPRLHPDNCDQAIVDVTTQHLERYASEGLRTLVIAQKEIPDDAFMEWSREYKAALSDLEQVQRQKLGEPNQIEELEESLEMGLELLGATAIEDRLQDQVTSTIADLARAGIKIWILTGDKEETAINIGFACQLLNNDMERLVINPDTYPTSSKLYDLLFYRCKELRAIRKDGASESARQQSIIIDGRSLAMVFSHRVLCDLFLEVSQYCAAVICCRVSPKQKAQVVRLYKTNIPGCRSLSIGDGANDVGMIQEAHIGIGISGHEGMQAVNSSDFAIAQFRFLKRLLLVHGHWNYRRMSKLALYVVYKNIILYCACFVLGTLSGGSGTLFYNNMWINGYNVFWTSLPIAIVGVLEQEVPAHLAYNFPGLYYAGAQGEQFSLKIFAEWIAEALYEGSVCALVPALLVSTVDSQGHSFSKDVCGAMSYSAMIVVGWAKLALNIVTWNYATGFVFAFSFIFWFFSAFVISAYLPTLVGDVAFPYTYRLPEFYLVIYLSILLCLGRDFLYKAYKREMYPEYYHILQEHHKCMTPEEDARWSPPNLRYHLFEADLSLPKPEFELLEQLASQASPATRGTKTDRQKAYTGFAFSTQILEDRFINPLRELVLPVTQVVDAIGRKFATRSPREGDEPSFEDKIKALPMEEQAVYEIQRFQIFSGWGSSLPGHLFITDPPRFTNADMSDGAWTFDLNDWIVDNRFGGSDQWQYATKFKDYLRDPQMARNLSVKERRRLRKKLNKLVGRSVRRRRWVRKEKVIAEMAASAGNDMAFDPPLEVTAGDLPAGPAAEALVHLPPPPQTI
ncbi:hypothetical protein Poli38472_002601 [Pythium oligandrum]|uniref:Phospholipid-transporting ATPase n=1 Tax=Pythium oligandrum TaxID=41045 RepID=A0A8K1FH93_PYTOL|nr:hypothetical protein Poli38472_002601 [Pythium oligandrum]|eukprot:TMW63660.1 hypothetical protein Poli38472_002601 [Pythium oligandrum]